MPTIRTSNQAGKAHPSVLFGSYSSQIASEKKGNESFIRLIPQIVDVLWTNQRLADAFSTNKRGWQQIVAEELNITAATVSKAIEAYGKNEFKELVAKNPAGQIPMVDRPIASVATSTYYSCPSSVSTCSGTCACQTGGCNTATCQSGACGTYICVNLKKAAPQGPK